METRRALRTTLISLPMLALTAAIFAPGGAPASGARLWGAALIYITFNSAFVLMVHTGKTDRWRAPIFFLYAVLFAVSLLGNLADLSALPGFNPDFMFEENAPICPIAVPFTLIPAALTRTLIWPGQVSGGHTSAASVLITWLAASLVLGRGWCSWTCFFGGFEDGFSRLLPAPVIKNTPKWLTSMPLALLIVFALLSAALMFPAYCIATCPFKTVTELPFANSAGDLVRIAIYTTISVLMVIVLPMLLKRRAQCSFLCPLGALQTGTNYITPFDIRVDTKACSKCGACVKACPVYAMTEDSLAAGRAGAACAKCGKCSDICPDGAVRFHVKGTPEGSGGELARLLFLYPAFLMMMLIMGSACVDGAARLITMLGRVL